jgi:hypothetical protein
LMTSALQARPSTGPSLDSPPANRSRSKSGRPVKAAECPLRYPHGSPTRHLSYQLW